MNAVMSTIFMLITIFMLYIRQIFLFQVIPRIILKIRLIDLDRPISNRLLLQGLLLFIVSVLHNAHFVNVLNIILAFRLILLRKQIAILVLLFIEYRVGAATEEPSEHTKAHHA